VILLSRDYWASAVSVSRYRARAPSFAPPSALGKSIRKARLIALSSSSFGGRARPPVRLWLSLILLSRRNKSAYAAPLLLLGLCSLLASRSPLVGRSAAVPEAVILRPLVGRAPPSLLGLAPGMGRLRCSLRSLVVSQCPPLAGDVASLVLASLVCRSARRKRPLGALCGPPRPFRNF
jgi:hypothetical protein